MELLVTIVVVTILLAAGVPAFKDFVKSNRVTAQANDLVSAIQLARSEALKRGSYMILCASDDQANCTGKDTWTNGWIIFSDMDPSDPASGPNPIVGTGKCLASEDCIIKISQGLSEGSTLTTNADFLCFLPTGLSGTHLPPSTVCSRDNADAVEFKLEARDCEKNQARKISVTPKGHTLVAVDKCS